MEQIKQEKLNLLLELAFWKKCKLGITLLIEMGAKKSLLKNLELREQAIVRTVTLSFGNSNDYNRLIKEKILLIEDEIKLLQTKAT